ncbi:MAG: hypothetical protein EAX96_13135 [Candidatus Lokiarchaeota archaeon]|nr:hypothetical protein [Candidatus Lokiarchaeota archaeon]
MDESVREKLKKIIIFSKDVTDLKGILDLPINKIKGLTKNLASVLKERLNVVKISDLVNLELNRKDLRFLESSGINQKDLMNWMLIAKMIDDATIDDYLGPRKISLVGLNNAGKSALLQILKEKVNLNLFGKILPTKGVYRDSIIKGDLEYVIWDMGGQDIYRQEYLKNVGKYFIGNELIVFVIDVQDKNNYNSAIVYLKDIINALEYLEENPNILVLINKVDPDIKNNKDILEDIKFLKKKIKEVFRDKTFNHEINTFSIYEKLTKDINVTKEIKDNVIVNVNKEFEKKEDENISAALEKVLNFMINLSASIEERLSAIENRIDNMAEWIEYFQQTPTMNAPQIYKDKADKIVAKTLSVKEAVANELKSILKMRKIE